MRWDLNFCRIIIYTTLWRCERNTSKDILSNLLQSISEWRTKAYLSFIYVKLNLCTPETPFLYVKLNYTSSSLCSLVEIYTHQFYMEFFQSMHFNAGVHIFNWKMLAVGVHMWMRTMIDVCIPNETFELHAHGAITYTLQDPFYFSSHLLLSSLIYSLILSSWHFALSCRYVCKFLQKMVLLHLSVSSIFLLKLFLAHVQGFYEVSSIFGIYWTRVWHFPGFESTYYKLGAWIVL